MDPVNIATMGVAVVAAFGAWASQRSAANASTKNSKTTAEVDAYNRARKMDVETIQRQDAEIEELRGKYVAIKNRLREVEADAEELRVDNAKLRRRIWNLERKAEDANEQ